MNRRPALLWALAQLPLCSALAAAEDATGSGLSLTGLLDLERQTTATLVEISHDEAPAALTVIDQDSIRDSGLLTLELVLEHFVPNLQMIEHMYGPRHVGIRGILSDRDDKILLLVNGRTLNEWAVIGAGTERDLPLMGDLRSITAVRGPGSAIYGPGAIAGVIALDTHNGYSFQGADITTRHSFSDDADGIVHTLEGRYGTVLHNGGALFLYAGVASQPGADSDDAPFLSGQTLTGGNTGVTIPAGDPIPFGQANDQADFRGRAKGKIHLQYNYQDWEVWARYTTGGDEHSPSRLEITDASGATVDNAWELQSGDQGYQQMVVNGRYHKAFTDELELDLQLGYGFVDWMRLRHQPERQTFQYRNHEIIGRAILSKEWRTTRLAAGLEYTWMRFNDDPSGFTSQDAFMNRVDEDSWETGNIAAILEWHQDWGHGWSSVLSARLDDHTYSDTLFSPRAALIYQPTEGQYCKLIASRSQRRPNDSELRQEHESAGTYGRVEDITSIEGSYERHWDAGHRIAAAVFGFESDLVAWNGGTFGSSSFVGDYSMYGGELEGTWHGGSWRIDASHAYTVLGDFDPIDPIGSAKFSVEPLGAGDHWSAWGEHISKLRFQQDINLDLDLFASLVYYWGFTGAEETTAYNNAQATPSFSMGATDPGNDRPFGPNAYLNLGGGYHLNDTWYGRLDLNNVLGWLDHDLNKRNYIYRVSEYRLQAPSVTLTLTARF